jgi:hypothetical membrane protein
LNAHSWLAFAGMAGPLVLIVSDITAGLASPEYSYLHDSISSLGLTNLGPLQSIGFLTIGLLVEVYVVGLLYNIKAFRGFHLSIGLLMFFGFGLLLIGAFRTDPVGAPDTVEGTIHSFSAIGSFSLFAVAILIIAPSLKNDRNWNNFYRYTIVTGILAVLFVLIMVIFQDDISWFGLFERLLVLNMVVWVEMTAIRLLVLSVRRSVKSEEHIPATITADRDKSKQGILKWTGVALGAGIAAYTGSKAAKKYLERIRKNKPTGTNSNVSETSTDDPGLKVGEENGKAGDENEEEVNNRDESLP